MDELPDEVAHHPLRDETAWLAFRDEGIAPLHQSELVTTQTGRDEFLVGAWLLGLLGSLEPQMLRVSDMLGAGLLMNAVIMPRRSSKTTTLFCILLGRCYLRPVHLAGFTLLTTQKKTSERYRLDIYGPIARRWPDEATRPVKLIKSNGSERVEFTNGSVLAVLSPDGDAIRSGAYDTLLMDESGECQPERWQDVIGAVLPAFDTRPEGQLILAGTAGDYRRGSEFWATLNDATAGVIRYTLPDDIDPAEIATWEPTEENPDGRARELTEQMHPGLHGLTTIDRLANNYARLGVAKYAREYFNLFGEEGSNTALISQPKWRAAARPFGESGPTPPPLLALGLSVHPDGLSASIAAAWKGEGEQRHVILLHHQEDTRGLDTQLLLIARKHDRAITFDNRNATAMVELAPLQRAAPPIQTRPLATRDIGRATVLLLKLLNADNLVHYGQPEMDGAAEIAVKRAMGDSGAYAFGRPDIKLRPGDDITPLEAAAMALYALEDEVEYGGLPEFVGV